MNIHSRFKLKNTDSISRFAVVFCVYICIFTQMLDTSIVNLALVIIAGDLGMDIYDSVWIVTSFLVGLCSSFAVFNLATKTFHESQLFLTSVFWFVLASFFCAISKEASILLVGRFFQGLTSGAILMLSQTLLVRNFSDERRAFAIALWGSALSLAPIFGPLIGGYITVQWGWRYLFFINVPLLGLCFMYLSYALNSNTNSKASVQKKAWLTALCSVVFMVTFLTSIEQGERLRWFESKLILLLVFLSGISLLAFFYLNRGDGNVLDFNILKNRRFRNATWVLSMGHALNFSSLIILPFWLQNSYHMPLLWTGLVVSINGLVTFLLTPIFAKIKGEDHLRILAVMSLLFMAVSFLMMSNFNLDSSILFICVSRMILGAGLSIFYTPLTVISYQDIDKSQITNANTISLIIRMIFTSLTLAIAYLFLKHLDVVYYADMASTMVSSDQEMDTAKLQLVRSLSKTYALKTIAFVASATCFLMFALGAYCLLKDFSREDAKKSPM